MAASLVESLGADFDPSQFHDDYRDAVEEMIERKRTTGETRPAPVAAAASDEGDSMTDLLSALQASVDAARAKAGGAPAAEEAPREGPREGPGQRPGQGCGQARPVAVVVDEEARDPQAVSRRTRRSRPASAPASPPDPSGTGEQVGQRPGAAEQVALAVVDAERAQVRHHRAPVDVLGHRAHAQLSRHPDDRGDQRAVDGVGRRPAARTRPRS